MSDEVFRFPRDDEHIGIFGRNGSGKTQYATFVLSERSFDVMPWYILNFKDEDLFYEIPKLKLVKIGEPVSGQPGVYMINCGVGSKKDDEELDDFFHRAWQHRNVGIFVDEGYNATGLKWFRSCLAQGRSRRVPLMVISQRPVYMDKFVWSEASLYTAFDLNIKDDKDTANGMIPGYRNVRLPEHHSLFHDVKANRTCILKPCPDRDTIMERFRERTKQVVRAI